KRGESDFTTSTRCRPPNSAQASCRASRPARFDAKAFVGAPEWKMGIHPCVHLR
ncbi:unnamed protein product, partial [Laminaria digitata]